ncbi:hypothetical protein TSAR_012286 [Trichomalopsis sarcophagae]|uniref:Uncharacterized protein n=1 Tax=Trichomalopsis sarcophagae TaxID=543379 RepID=A0A232FP69_9HYME|nr:hypothetical protein TSAR_012286 [Trichomalopsis sarcophagae]
MCVSSFVTRAFLFLLFHLGSLVVVWPVMYLEAEDIDPDHYNDVCMAERCTVEYVGDGLYISKRKGPGRAPFTVVIREGNNRPNRTGASTTILSSYHRVDEVRRVGEFPNLPDALKLLLS